MLIKLTFHPSSDWAPWTAAVLLDGKVEIFANGNTPMRALALLSGMDRFIAMAAQHVIAAAS